MKKFIYLFIKNWLDAYGVEYKHYELYNGQPTNLEYSNPYPAIYLEILPIEWNNLLNGVQEAVATIRIHLVNEVFSSFDADDKSIDKSLEHLDFETHIYRALDMKSSDDDNIPQLVNHQEYYNINTMNRIRSIQNNNVKSRFITIIDYSAAIRDYSHWKYQDHVDFSLSGITGKVDSNTGSTFNISGNF